MITIQVKSYKLSEYRQQLYYEASCFILLFYKFPHKYLWRDLILSGNSLSIAYHKLILITIKFLFQLNKYWHEKVLVSRIATQSSVEEVASIVHNILKQVEVEEPRFSCTLSKTANNRYDGKKFYQTRILVTNMS